MDLVDQWMDLGVATRRRTEAAAGILEHVRLLSCNHKQSLSKTPANQAGGIA